MICKNCGAHFGDLSEAVPKMYTKELKTQTGQLRKIFLIVGGLIAALALLFFLMFLLLESMYKKDAKAELLFTREAFPVMDEYYETGDYDGLLNYYQTALLENEHANFYNWKHYAFLTCYENYCFFMEDAKKMDTPDFTDYDMQELFYFYISNYRDQKGYPMDENDQHLAASLQGEMKAVIDSLKLTKDEESQLNDLLNTGSDPTPTGYGILFR